MSKNLLFTFMFSLVFSTLTIAQDILVKGRVIDNTGEGVPGATVQEKGTTNGVAADYDGNYSVKVSSKEAVLIFASIGYATQEVAVGSKSVVNVTLGDDTKQLDEVVVVAYGEQSKRSITGAVSSLSSETLSNQIAVSPLRAIQGSSPGVNVITTGGQPGEDPTIRIRGIASINASADPLIVVDGVVFSGKLSNISAEQIETINTLKDASATALYGSRGSNGVILITTKNGSYGQEMKISASAKAGFANPAVEPYDVVGAEEYMKLQWESLRNGYQYTGAKLSADQAGQKASDKLISFVGYNPYNMDNPVGADGQIVSGAELMWDTDWFDALQRDKASFNDYSVSIQGGSDKITYFFSTNYLKQEGSVLESEFERYTTRLNLEAKVKEWFKLGVKTSYSKSSQNYPLQSGTSYASTIAWAYAIPAAYPIYRRNQDGSFRLDDEGNKLYDYGQQFAGENQTVNASRPRLDGENAVSSTQINDILYKRFNYLVNAYAKFDLYKGISFKSSYAYENYTFDGNEYGHYALGSAASVGGRVGHDRNMTETYTFTNSLNYKGVFGDHTVYGDLINEVYDYSYDRLGSQGTGFLPGVKVLSGSTKPESVTGYLNQERLVSYLGRVRYSFKDKYFLNASFRRDGSTRFAEEHRWGNFYSLGASWVVSDEAFLESFDAISFLKVRTSFGSVGNNRGIGYFPYLQTFDTGWNNGDNTGVIKDQPADNELTWEKTESLSIGVDYAFLDNKISGSIDYYNKETTDLLFDKPLATSTGNSELTTNIGSLSNKGWEFVINSRNIETEDILWTTSFNIASNKTEFLSLPQEVIISGSKKLEVGRPIFDFYMAEYAGVNPQNGYALWYEDIEGEDGEVIGRTTTEVYEDATQYEQGTALPDFTGGFSSYFKYKNFDLNVMFNYSLGGKIYDSSYAGLMGPLNAPARNSTSDIDGRWRRPGDDTDIPLLINSNVQFTSRSTRFLFDNDYLRLKAVTLGYNLPKTLLKKINVGSLRVFVQGDNLFTWQSHEGIDPEQNLSGTTNNRSYIMKTITAGITIEL